MSDAALEESLVLKYLAATAITVKSTVQPIADPGSKSKIQISATTAMIAEPARTPN